MSAYIPVDIRRSVREKFDDRCAYCRTAEFLTSTTFEFEHITPRSAGGETVFDNVCLACPMCNRFKTDSLTASDPQTGVVVPIFHPHQQIWSDHFAFNDDGTELIGLTDVGRATVVALKINRPAMIRVRKLWVAMGEHPPTQ